MSQKDCWMIETCEKYDVLHKYCTASTDDNFLGTPNRCDAGTKTIIKILSEIDAKLDKIANK